MRVIYKKPLFLCECLFEERHLPKKAGFRWDSLKKYWYTEEPKQAALLRNYCGEEALKVINSILLLHKPWEECLRVPEGLSLFPFQEKAVLFSLERNRSYLALDPGLGKTICAAIISLNLNVCVVYICPPFLVETVREEFAKWAPGIFVFVIPDSQLAKYRSSVPENCRELLIVDEAHRFKTDSAQRTKILFGEYFPHFKKAVFMSGTPMPNSPMELYSVLSKAAPECIDFKSKFDYGMVYCAGFKNQWGYDFSGASNMKHLHESIMGKFMLRLKKADVLPELPPKTESLVVLAQDLPASLRKLEAKVLSEVSPHDLMKGVLNSEHIATYRRELGMAKVEMAVDFISTILEETDESVLVFAIHKDVIAKLTSGLKEYFPLVITGDTAMEERHKLVQIFQEKEHRTLFIGNIQAAGTGFTLTKATRVIFVEFSWTPSDNEQAADRAHRVGQKDNVLVHYLVYKNSVDRAVLETIFEKQRAIKHI